MTGTPCTVRFQVDGAQSNEPTLCQAKALVRMRYPRATFTPEDGRVACEEDGDLVAEIVPSERVDDEGEG